MKKTGFLRKNRFLTRKTGFLKMKPVCQNFWNFSYRFVIFFKIDRFQNYFLKIGIFWQKPVFSVKNRFFSEKNRFFLKKTGFFEKNRFFFEKNRFGGGGVKSKFSILENFSANFGDQGYVKIDYCVVTCVDAGAGPRGNLAGQSWVCIYADEIFMSGTPDAGDGNAGQSPVCCSEIIQSPNSCPAPHNKQ